ncbi:MAG: Re/Si-specific NAD(P)(+) transhydrogenase subunit alpha [Neomegalonema sp.]|nr:Re/Si-specific NAD(P)(+) transhydrogenase subunit alpha [Neomegalonema sp.]
MGRIVGVPRELTAGERRVALTPETAGRIQKLGYSIIVESGAGADADISDDAYRAANVEVVNGAAAVWERADIVMKVRPPAEHSDFGAHEADLLREGQTLICFLWPGQNEALMQRLAERKPHAVLAMDMVPRISRAQKMDALSSMANIAGYRAVIEASNNFGRFFTGQVTAAGKVPPAKVLVVGAGVAGLAAIGAARGLGAIVRAFDVRPEVAEQIESMGAEFLMLDFEEDSSGDGGYAKPSSPEFREKQLAMFREQAPEIDIVITTALIPGRPAPKLWLKDMVELQKPGSVVVDLAAEQGGNCDLTEPGEKVLTENGVTIVGYTDLPSRMASQSSQLFGTNLRHMLDDLTPEKDGEPNVNMEDDVIRGATVVKDGEITFPPPAPKVQAIAKPQQAPKGPSPEEQAALDAEAARKAGRAQWALLGVGTLLMLLIGSVAPASFMQHFIVFVLACFVGYQVIWNVTHALHTPLMAVTNAISGIIILGAILQIGSSSGIVLVMSAISVLIATINIAGGFLVTRRMLAMFQKS